MSRRPGASSVGADPALLCLHGKDVLSEGRGRPTGAVGGARQGGVQSTVTNAGGAREKEDRGEGRERYHPKGGVLGFGRKKRSDIAAATTLSSRAVKLCKEKGGGVREQKGCKVPSVADPSGARNVGAACEEMLRVGGGAEGEGVGVDAGIGRDGSIPGPAPAPVHDAVKDTVTTQREARSGGYAAVVECRRLLLSMYCRLTHAVYATWS